MVEVLIYPYRPDGASDDPRERLADGPRRVRGALAGFVALGVLCALALVVLVLIVAFGGG